MQYFKINVNTKHDKIQYATATICWIIQKIFLKRRWKVSALNLFSALPQFRYLLKIGEEFSANHCTRKIVDKNYWFQTSIARFGSTVNFLVVGPLHETLLPLTDKKDALGWTLAISGITCIFSVTCAIVSSNFLSLVQFSAKIDCPKMFAFWSS